MSDNNPDGKTSKANQSGFIGLLRTVALITLVVGATGSLIFMFRQSQNTPRFLLVLFTFWVLSPFTVLLWANVVSKHWSVITRIMLYGVTLIIALVSPAIYGEWIDVKPVGSANAFLFVVVPPVSLLFFVIVPITAFISRKLSHRSDGK
jgi:hypothetical protein